MGKLLVNGKEASKIYLGGDSVSTVWKDGKNIFSGDYVPEDIPEEYKYIEIEIDSSSGTFTIPLSCIQANGVISAINIYVNGEFITEYRFTSSYSAGTGYILTGLQNSTSVIRIEPAGKITIGWGRFFGFYNNTMGSNEKVNRAKVISIINDPDWIHLESATYTGSYFRAYQYIECTNLRIIPDETIPDGITTVGNNFRSSSYYGCTNLLSAPDEFLPDSISTIGIDFRSYQYYNCIRLAAASKESMPMRITDIKNNFRIAQYRECSSLTSPCEEVMPEGVKTIANDFRKYQYSGTGLRTAPDESLPDSVITIGDNFRYYQYLNCRSLTKASSIESLPDKLPTIGTYFRRNQYEGCSSLLIGNYIHSHHLRNLLTCSTNYYYMFNLSSGKTTSDTVPRYYTDSTQTTTAPVTDLIPTSRIYYLTNRTGIEGYENIHGNWK